MADDLMRSLGHGRPWILMEQTTSRVNWREINVPKPPGVMRLWSYQAIARGADGIMFFQWRQSRAGAEKFHSAVVPHGPVEESPTWHEARRLGRELQALDAVAATRAEAEVAILLDWNSWWALEMPSKPSTRVGQMAVVEAVYAALYEANVTVDFAHPEDDLSAYRLVLAPALYLVTDRAAANLERFVSAGGALVMTFFSGIVDPQDHIRLGGYPQPFRDVLGLKVIDFTPLLDGEGAELHFADGTRGQGTIWSELIEPAGAEVLATFEKGPLAGRPAITRHTFEKGTAFYLGTLIEPAAMARILRAAASHAGVAPVAEVPHGVEAVRRGTAGKSILFLLNHLPTAVDVPLADAGTNLIDGREVHRGLLRLEPRGVAVIKEGW
jgi:beta-galactosidase